MFVDLEFAGQFGRHFDKHLRLQFGKMTEKTRHAATGMMLGQPVSSDHVRTARIAGGPDTIFAAREPLHAPVSIAPIERLVYRILQRRVVCASRPMLATLGAVQL